MQTEIKKKPRIFCSVPKSLGKGYSVQFFVIDRDVGEGVIQATAEWTPSVPPARVMPFISNKYREALLDFYARLNIALPDLSHAK